MYSNGKKVPVRVYTTRGLEQQGLYALEHAHKTLDFFSEVKARLHGTFHGR